MIDFLQFLLRERSVAECLQIVQHLRRTGCAGQHARDNSVPEDPGQGHLRKALPAFCGKLVQLPDLPELFLRQGRLLEKARIRTDAAVFRNAVEIAVAGRTATTVLPLPSFLAVSFRPFRSIVRSNME